MQVSCEVAERAAAPIRHAETEVAEATAARVAQLLNNLQLVEARIATHGAGVGQERRKRTQSRTRRRKVSAGARGSSNAKASSSSTKTKTRSIRRSGASVAAAGGHRGRKFLTVSR